ncbi:MAG TPA: PDZ domain-containing protein [Kofleriaceae bacterium]
MRWWLPIVLGMGTTASAAPRQSNPAFLGIGFAQGPGTCVIESVTDGGPASDAGIEIGDQVIAFDLAPLDKNASCDQLVSNITAHAPGDRIRIDFVRGVVHREVTATLATRAEVVQRKVGQRIGTTDLVDVDDARRHYDLSERGKTTVVGFFTEHCSGCAHVFDRVTDGLKAKSPSVSVLAVTPRDTRYDVADLRKTFTSSVPLAVADNETFEALAMTDQDRALFMVIDCKGIVRLVAPLAPDAEDLDAAVDEVLAGAAQAEHSRRR